ncbi:unnamed protein product [Gordionus sp. m RMFG-2023]
MLNIFFHLIVFYLESIFASKDIYCYECASSAKSSSSIDPGCQNFESCCKDPFITKNSVSKSLIKKCSTGVCLKTTYHWGYKYRNDTYFERKCFDPTYIALLFTPEINKDNKMPTIYQDARSEEAKLELRDMKCVDIVRQTPTGKAYINVCSCKTDHCNSAPSTRIKWAITFSFFAIFICSRTLFF